MPVSLTNIYHLGLGSVGPNNWPNSILLDSGRALFYQLQQSGDVLLVNTDFTGQDITLYADPLDQLISMGSDGAGTDYFVAIRGQGASLTEVDVDLWSIDPGASTTLLDTLALAVGEETPSGEWGQPTLSGEFLLPYDYQTAPGSGIYVGKLTKVSRSGTTLSNGTIIDTGDIYFGNFVNSSPTNVDRAWFATFDLSFNFTGLTLIDGTTLSSDAFIDTTSIMSSYAIWTWAHNGSDSGIISYNDPSSDPVVGGFTASGITTEFNASTTYRVIDMTYDVHGNKYVVFSFSTGTISYYVYVDDGSGWGIVDTVPGVTGEFQQPGLSRFLDGVIFVLPGLDPSDPTIYYYTGAPAVAGPSNDDFPNAIVLDFPYSSVLSASGSLHNADGKDVGGTPISNYSNVWYTMTVPDNYFGDLAFQVDIPPGTTSSHQIDVNISTQDPVTINDTNTTGGAPKTTLLSQANILSGTDWTLGFVNAGEVVTIEVARNYLGSVSEDTEFVLRWTFYQMTENVPSLITSFEPPAHEFFMAEFFDGSSGLSERPILVSVGSSGVPQLYAVPDRNFSPEGNFDYNDFLVWTGIPYGTYNGFRSLLPPVLSNNTFAGGISDGFYIRDDRVGFQGFGGAIEITNLISRQLVDTITVGSPGITCTPIGYDNYIYYVSDSHVIRETIGSHERVVQPITVPDGWQISRMARRADGRIVLVLRTISFSVNYYDYSSPGIVLDGDTLSVVDSVSWSNAPYGYMLNAISGTLDAANHAWGFSNVTYFGPANLGVTYDGKYIVSGYWYPSVDLVAGFASWGYQYQSSIFRTDLFTGVTSLWFHLPHGTVDVHGPDETSPFALDRRSYALRGGGAPVYPFVQNSTVRASNALFSSPASRRNLG